MKEFDYNGMTYVLTDGGESCGGHLVRYTVWTRRGQQVDASYVLANSFGEAIRILTNNSTGLKEGEII